MSGTTFKSIFSGKQYQLEEKIDADHGLLSKLEAYKVITRMHRDAIEVNYYCVTSLLLLDFCRLVEHKYMEIYT